MRATPISAWLGISMMEMIKSLYPRRFGWVSFVALVGCGSNAGILSPVGSDAAVVDAGDADAGDASDAVARCVLTKGSCSDGCAALLAYPVDVGAMCFGPGEAVACATSNDGMLSLTCAVQPDGGLWAFTTSQIPTGTDFSACNAAQSEEVVAVASACDAGGYADAAGE